MADSPDLSSYSDAELEKIAAQSSSTEPDLSQVPDSELERVAKQGTIDSGADKVRQFVGKAAIAGNALPALIGEQLATGRLFKPDPLESAVGTMVDGAAQTASYGIPKAIAKRIMESQGLQYPEAKDKASETAGKIIGLLAPGATAQSLAKKIPGLVGQTMAKDIMRGAAEGAFVGFTESPDDFMDIKQRIKQGAIGGAIGGAVVPIAGAIDKVAFKATQLAEDVRNSLFEAKKGFGKQFESQLDSLIEANPGKVISAEEAFTNLNEAAKSNSRVITDLKLGAKRAGLDPDVISGFIKDPSTASELTLNQARELKQAVSNIPGVKANYAKGKFANWQDHQIDLIDFADDIKNGQLGAFPEMAQINKTYSDQLTKYNSIKNKFKVGKLLDNMEKNFGDPEIQKIVRELLPKETIQKIGGYRSATRLLRHIGWAGVVGTGIGIEQVVASGAGSAIKNLFSL